MISLRLISTQHVSTALKGNLNKDQFLQQIGTEGNQLRSDLSGDMIETLTGFLGRAAKGGSINAALYELTDAQLVRSLVALGTKLNIVLADIINKEKSTSDRTPDKPLRYQQRRPRPSR
ncbi:MAG: hypothetical protein JO232_02095 [Verrucomicrobia bacterium]|nr:hypothetical protein [Verrucomicrobiota bacterium]